jgi:glucosyl-3-phosphoglycerate synthase
VPNRRTRLPRPDRSALAEVKRQAGLTVSVCLPAQDEEATVGPIVTRVRRGLMGRVPLVDEIVVLDDRSRDRTARVAARAGARVVAVEEVLPEAGPGSGKGNALWKSLFVADGDLLCWLDADVRNFDADFVARLVAPLLYDSQVGFVKAFYARPLHRERRGGGRVTELTARPLVSHLFPELAMFVQPLAGEYATRRTLVDQLPFVQGWGIELGLLIDFVRRFGLAAVVQVDLGVRRHRNRPLAELGPQALAILITALRRAGFELDHPNVASELVRFADDNTPERIAVEVGERPPMLSVPAYREKFGRAATIIA